MRQLSVVRLEQKPLLTIPHLYSAKFAQEIMFPSVILQSQRLESHTLVKYLISPNSRGVMY